MDDKNWQLDKTVSLGNIGSAVMIIFSVMWWGSEIDKRIADNDQQLIYVQKTQERDREEWRSDDEDIKESLEKINTKLNKIIEK